MTRPAAPSPRLPSGDDGTGARRGPDFSAVLVAGASTVTRVVVSRVVERCGLTPLAGEPGPIAEVLLAAFPAIAVLDGGAHNDDCEALLPVINTLRQASASRLPAVILLSNRLGTRESLGLPPVVDAVVAKPITTERLQSAVHRLLAELRDGE